MYIQTCGSYQETPTTKHPRGLEDKMFCGCCLSNNEILLKAKTCSHLLFYEKVFYTIQKVTLKMSYICITCHSFMKKINNFHNMTIESQNLLNSKVVLYNSKKSKNEQALIKHLVIEPTELIIKTEDENVPNIENTCSNKDQKIIHEKIIKKEEIIIETDYIDQNEPNIDDPYSNEMIDDIDEYTTSNTNNEIDGEYNFDQFIDFAKPKQAVFDKGVVIPYLSTSISGKSFQIPQIDSKEFKCIVVTLRDALEEFNKKKDSVQYKQMLFKCTKCFESFNSKSLYEGHEKKHLMQEEHLNNHLICDICQCVILPLHSEMHYANHFLRYQCIQCCKMYSNLRRAKAHYIDAHDKSLKQCNLCEFTTTSGRTLRYHKEKKHNGSNECTSCGKILSNQSALKYHIMTVHNTGPLQLSPCPHCNKLLRPQSLKVHIKDVHDGDVNAFCVDCKKHFKTNKCLQQHFKYHKNHIDIKRRVICDHCGKEFKRKPYLLTHIMRTHMPAEKYKCRHCDKGRCRQHQIQVSMHLKLSTRPITNTNCHRDQGSLRRLFSRQYYAIQHEKKVHLNDVASNARNHICDYCGKGFTKAMILKAHVRIHTGERPYKCNICEAAFTQSGPLGTHKRLVHLQKRKNKLNE